MQKHAGTERFRSSIIPQTLMPKAVLVKRGEEYLPDVPLVGLVGMYRNEPPASPGTGFRRPCSESAAR